MELMERVPENIRIYIQEIAERMSQGKAAVMVGSGFSKNAKNYRYTEKKFMDWNQLGDIFYKKLYGRLPSEEDAPCYYQDPLKLAGKVEQCLGRKTLDMLILDNLPDEEYEPSELHEALLRLNWTDIFTTNYDTLLERTRARVFNNRYQVVLSKEDLVYSKCPRIIKLHGSFPSTRPFIVTEEDYRKYPRDFAVFVNTVRQALIENVMCMVGFSGDDPNFLNWIGWVRDCLGREASSRIYMVGVFDMGEVERKLYDSRNIVLINMKECSGVGEGNYAEGLKLFFEAVEFFQRGEEEDKSLGKSEEEANVETLCCRSMMLLKRQPVNFLEKIKENMRTITGEWGTEREGEIDWFVIPYQRRRKIEKTLKYGNALTGMLHTVKPLEGMLDVVGAFLYEYNWRRERCFFSLDADGARTYGEYLSSLKDEWKEVDIELGFSLLEYLREHGEFDKWELLVSKLEKHMYSTQEKRLYCEKAMKMLYNLECGDLATVLIDLSGSVHRVGLEFKISALLAELGYYEKAILLLKKNLDEVRKQMGNNIDYHNFSREAYLIDLLENLQKYYDHFSGVKNVGKDMDSRSRLKILKSYDCNPEYERDYLVQQLISYTNSGAVNVPCQLAEGAKPEQYIKFMERTGMVFRSAYFFEYTDEFPVLVKGMIGTNPYLALLCTFRYGEKAACKRIWDKDALEDMEPAVADRLIKQCIQVCENNEEYLRSDKTKENNLADNLPELAPSVIAGLVTKASVEGSYDVMEFAAKILEGSKDRYLGIKEMLKATVSRCAKLKPKDLLTRWMEFPLGCKENEGKDEVIEPFLYMDFIVADVDIPDSGQIEKLKHALEAKEKDCEWAVYARLLVTEIICNMGNIKSEITIEIEDKKLVCPNEFYEIVTCYKAKYGNKDAKAQVKKEWIEQLENQIDQFAKNGEDYCDDFQRGVGKLLKKIIFFQDKCVDFSWNCEELNQTITILGKWADAVYRMVLALCNNIMYYDGWNMLEIILLKILSLDKIELKMETSNNLQSLEEKLKRVQIPFLLRRVLMQLNNGNREEAGRQLFAALMKGGHEQAEAGRILKYIPQLQACQISLDIMV